MSEKCQFLEQSVFTWILKERATRWVFLKSTFSTSWNFHRKFLLVSKHEKNFQKFSNSVGRLWKMDFTFCEKWISQWNFKVKCSLKTWSDKIFEISVPKNPNVQIFMKKHLAYTSNEMFQWFHTAHFVKFDEKTKYSIL